MPTDDFQMPEMGQFWLWDISPMHEEPDLWSTIPYHL